MKKTNGNQAFITALTLFSLLVTSTMTSLTTYAYAESRYGFSPEDDEIIENQAKIYQRAVLSDDRATVSEFYAYPFTAKIWKKKDIYISDSDEFIKNYDKLFSDDFKKCMKEAIPKDMFIRDIGIHFGCVWFEYTDGRRLKVINPTFF